MTDGCEEFMHQQPVTDSCIALKIDSDNEFNEKLVWEKLRDTLKEKYKKILETFVLFHCVSFPEHVSCVYINRNYSRIYFMK